MVELGLSFCIGEWVLFFYGALPQSLSSWLECHSFSCYTFWNELLNSGDLFSSKIIDTTILIVSFTKLSLVFILFISCLTLHHFSNVWTISIFVATGRSKKEQHWEDNSFWKRCSVCPCSIMCFNVFPALLCVSNFLKIFWSMLSFWYHNKYAISVLVSI